ncbi:MAG: glycosyltransferase involved in cell wall biosynthesis [Planctomycetota bacterium]|jgi:glycosyltransferase involved in cell wall biosynthesis
MKVLFVCPFFPWPLNSGGKIRTFNLIKSLGRDVEIHLRAITEPGTDREGIAKLSGTCAGIKLFDRVRPGRVMRWSRPKLERWFYSPALRQALAKDLRDDYFDIVHLDELLLARTLPSAPGIPVIQHHHKLDTVLYDDLSGHKGLHRHFDLWKLHRLESEAARRYPHHVVCGENDAHILGKRYEGLNFGVVPSGIDPDFFKPRVPAAPRTRHRILYLGTLSYGPNIDAVRHFVAKVLPGLRERFGDLEFDLVGGGATREVLELHGQGVNVIGGVPDVRPYLEGAALMVVPLRIGGGTRLKIVEALAMGCPVVSSAIGAEGLGLEDGVHLRITESETDLEAAVVEMLEKPEEALVMAERGQAYVREHFTWEVLSHRLLDFWKSVHEQSRSHAPASSDPT